MRRRMRFASAVAAALLASPAVLAQSESDRVAAETLFDEARRLMEAKQYDQACPKLAESQKLDPGVGTLLNLGRCYKEAGRAASAWSVFREAAALARTSGQPDREELARQEASALEPKLVRLVIEVPSNAKVEGLTIRQDGAVVPSALWGVATPVDAGDHVIEVSAPGRKPARLSARAEKPGTVVKVSIPALEAGPAEAATPAPAAPQASSGGAPAEAAKPAPASSSSTLAYVIGGVGAASLATGAVFGVLAITGRSKAEDLCPDSPCSDREGVNANEDAKTAAWVSNIGIGIGVVGLGVATVMLLTGNEEPERTAVAAELGPRGGGVTLSTRW